MIIGLFRFSDSSDSIYFIYICLIAFALAALPWISSFRVNGLFEIEREIEKTKDETRERIEQTDKRFEDRMFSMRAELMASLTSIQSQMAQQSAILNSTQSQVSQQSTIQASRQSNSQIIAIGDIVKALDKNTEDDTSRQSKEIVKIENTKKNIENYEEDVVNAIASGNGPDILSINNSWLPEYLDKVQPAPDKLYMYTSSPMYLSIINTSK